MEGKHIFPEHKTIPVAMREKPIINDKDAERISSMIRHNNERIEGYIERLKEEWN